MLSRSETEYEAICCAVMETMRGRWFLSEYARRNRNSDTKVVLAAIERIEAAMQAGNATPSLPRLRAELAQMQRAIASTKLDLAAIESDLQYQTGTGTATSARAAATSDIFAVVGRLQAAASTLRARGVQLPLSEQLDQCAAEILAACASHNITEQRTRQVMQVLRYLEGRINTMVDIWGGFEAPVQAEETKAIERHASSNGADDHAKDAVVEIPRANGSCEASEFRGDESGDAQFSHVAVVHEVVDPEPATDNDDRLPNVFVLDAETVPEPAAAPLTGDVPAEPASVKDARSSPAEAATQPIATAAALEPPDAFA